MSRKFIMKIPSRINILGNPTDGNEGDFATISAAINVFAGGTIEDADEYIYQWIDRKKPNEPIAEYRTSEASDIDYDEGDPLRLLKGTLRYLIREYPGAGRKISKHGMKISIWTDVPRQSGLGGSSLPILLIIEGIKKLYNLDGREFNPYVVSEIAQRVEEKELNITCGFSDRYIPRFGGLAYLDYRGKLHHEAIGKEPYVTYERLDNFVPSIGFIILSSGIPHDSGNVHSIMRKRYLEDIARVERRQVDPSSIIVKFKVIGGLAWQGKIALLSADYEQFGLLMNQNHRLIDEIMHECGFEQGAGKTNNIFIETALNAGALGAKLTGAGSGGSVLVFAHKSDEPRIVKAIKKRIVECNFNNARVMKVSVVKTGLSIKSK